MVKPELAPAGIFPIDKQLVEKINGHLANEVTSKLAAVVLFWEDEPAKLYVRNADDPAIVDAYLPESNVNLKRTDYVVCVRYERPPQDPSWMIINNKSVHIK